MKCVSNHVKNNSFIKNVFSFMIIPSVLPYKNDHEKYFKPFLILYMVVTFWNCICLTLVMLINHHGCLSDKEIPLSDFITNQKGCHYQVFISYAFHTTRCAKAKVTLFILKENSNRVIIMFFIRHFLYRLMSRIKVYIIVYFRLSKEPTGILQDSKREETLHLS